MATGRKQRQAEDAAGTALMMKGVTRRYGRARDTSHALRGVEVALPRGSFTAVMGPSGSGKSTLLQCAVGLDRPTAGSVWLGGQELTGMSGRALTSLRRTRVGFVFQSFNLLPALTAEQNVALPLRLAGGRRFRRRVHRERAREALARVGLGDRARSRPSELSGGQQQRVALARALVTEPEIICADEPTGALDPVTAEEVLALLRQSVDGLGATVLMVTHDPVAAACADRVLFLADGLVADEFPATSDPAVRGQASRPEAGRHPGSAVPRGDGGTGADDRARPVVEPWTVGETCPGGGAGPGSDTRTDSGPGSGTGPGPTSGDVARIAARMRMLTRRPAGPSAPQRDEVPA